MGQHSMSAFASERLVLSPDFNTIATYVRRLEQHGMIKHQELSPRFYTYQAAVSREQYVSYINKESITRFFDGSYMDFISRLVKHHEVSIDELKELIRMVEEDDVWCKK